VHRTIWDCYANVIGSIEQTFNNCLTSLSDFKELTPEFYESNGEFLQNIHRINFGIKHDGQAVNDVELPPWAKCKQAVSAILFLFWEQHNKSRTHLMKCECMHWNYQ